MAYPEHFTGLIEAIERLAGASAIDDVVDVVRGTARRLVGADGIAVILREGELCHYVEEDAMGPLWKGQTFPIAACVSGWAMLNHQTVVIEDIRADERIPMEFYEDTFVRSLAMAPVRSDDPIGAIGAYWAEIRRPTADEVHMLEALARATATAIENVRLIKALSRALSDAELARDELRHRVKNAFAATQALATLSLPSEHARVLSARISALARAHELLDQKLAGTDSITVGELLETELQPYEEAGEAARLRTQGPRVAIGGREAVALGLAVNELATNALKHGALSTPQGRVEIRWQVEDRHLLLDWRESEGPAIKANAVENFGSRLLRRIVEGQLGGSIRRDLASSGATCRIEFPLGSGNPQSDHADAPAPETVPQD